MVEEERTQDESIATRRGRLGALSDRVPTSWVGSIALAGFLGITAAFGGLDATEPDPIPQVSAGEDYSNEQIRLNVERAVLIDDIEEFGITPEAGQRVLTVIVEVENLRDEPLSEAESLTPTVRLAQFPDLPPAGVMRYDDGTNLALKFQPGVPAVVVIAWLVDEGTFAADQDLLVEFWDQAYTEYTFFEVDGGFWTGSETSAIVTVPVTDVGAGLDT